MSALFEIDQRLAADTFQVCDWTLSQVRLMNDRRYPWVILIPRRANIREWSELDPGDGQQLWQESMQLSRALQQSYPGDKLNIAALGNVVPQLHLHHVMRRPNDPAWPGPVWGHSPAVPYSETERDAQLTRLRSVLLCS